MSSCPPFQGVGEVALRYIALVHHVHVHHVHAHHVHVHHVHSPSHNLTITISPSPSLCHHHSFIILPSQSHHITILPLPSRRYHLAVTIFHRPLTTSAIWQTRMSLSVGRRKKKKKKKNTKPRVRSAPNVSDNDQSEKLEPSLITTSIIILNYVCLSVQ